MNNIPIEDCLREGERDAVMLLKQLENLQQVRTRLLELRKLAEFEPGDCVFQKNAFTESFSIVKEVLVTVSYTPDMYGYPIVDTIKAEYRYALVPLEGGNYVYRVSSATLSKYKVSGLVEVDRLRYFNTLRQLNSNPEEVTYEETH